MREKENPVQIDYFTLVTLNNQTHTHTHTQNKTKPDKASQKTIYYSRTDEAFFKIKVL
jgi:hypothetical protein